MKSKETNAITPPTAEEKCQAVLSLWSERRKVSEVCREFKIKWATLNHWQDRALEGMLQALEPRINLKRGPLLSPRLQNLLAKKSKPRDTIPEKTEKLKERLAQVQSSKPEKSPPAKTKKK